MKFYTSYFYKIRFMKPHQIPFSTAVWNPKFFSRGGKPFFDKNGVINGLRAMPLVPGPLCSNDCRGPEQCATKNPANCNFLKHYRQQLDQLDFNFVTNRCEEIANAIKNDIGFKEEPEIILLVYETPKNPCSERCVIQEWFKDNGITCEEWNNDQKRFLLFNFSTANL